MIYTDYEVGKMSFKQWLFSEGINKISHEEYLYQTRHLIAIGLAIGLVIFFGILFKHNKKRQNIVLTTIAVILLFFEITSRITNFIELNEYTFVKLYDCLIPCHFCSVMVVLMIITHFFKIEKLFTIISVGGILATSTFLIYPAVGFNTEIIGFSQLYSISSHVLGFIYAVLLLIYHKATLNLVNLKRIIIFFGIIIIYGILLEFVINPGSNYYYFFEDEIGLNAPLFVYQLLIGSIVVSYIAIIYFINHIINKYILPKLSKKIKYIK